MKPIEAFLLFAACFAGSAPAGATLSVNTTGLASPAQTVTFESTTLGRNEVVTDQFAALGVTFSTAFGNPDPSDAYPNISGNRIGNFDSGRTQSGLFTISFAAPVSEAAFALVTAPGTSTFQAFLGGALVETDMHSTSITDFADYFAFRDIVFDEITIGVDSFNRTLMMDNLQTVGAQVAAVPEPESWALMLGGLMAVGSAARRRRSSLRRPVYLPA